MQVVIVADVGKEELLEFLQHMRNFDTRHPHTMMSITAVDNGEEASTKEEVRAAMQKVDPPFAVMKEFGFREGDLQKKDKTH